MALLRNTGVRWWSSVVLTAALASPVIVAPHARADDFVDRVNKSFPEVAPARRSDLILLPLLAKMAPPPKGVQTLDAARQMPVGGAGWAEAKSWAEGATQKAVLDALPALVKESDARKIAVFAQPYGIEGVPIEMIRARLYTELGDPPTLSGARFLYLDALSNLNILVHVEATRRNDAGDPLGAMTLLTDFAFFARQIGDREFYKEVVWSLHAMTSAVERMRDIAYVDSKGKRALSAKAADGLPALIERLEPEKGYFNLPRLRLPSADRVGTEQIVARVFVNRGGVNNSTFAGTMSRLGSTDRPLRLFSESAKWDAVAARQKGWFDITDELPKVYDDWSSRWDLDQFDRRMETPFYASKLDRGSYAVIAETMPLMEALFFSRQTLRTEIVGTRSALGVLGYFYSTKSFPPQLSSIRPKWIKELDADPFNPNRARGAKPPMEFFVPIRDQTFGPREEPKPHEVSVFAPGGDNFNLKFKEDQFLLYSVGGDGAKNFAAKVENSPGRVPGADYLIWPPVRSLYRQYLMDKGQLK